MEKNRIVIGVAATRRDVFSVEEAIRYKDIVLRGLSNFDVEVVGIDDINAEGLLLDEAHIAPIVEKFKKHGVNGVFFPHTNFGSEFLVAQAAKLLGLPVLLWGPRDDAPDAGGVRSRDTQCGLFATGKVLRRFHVPFTYIVNCRLEDRQFTEGFARFTAVCGVVKAFRRIRILQVSNRPSSFWTMIVNEGELLERFGIQVLPATLTDVAGGAKKIAQEKGEAFEEARRQLKRMDCSVFGGTEKLEAMAALKVCLKRLCEANACTAVALQCWSSLQQELGIMPCMANGLLAEEGIPSVCETDIHGAISAVLLQEAVRRASPVFFADLTVRHPENDNAELLWHCGNFPLSLAKHPDKACADRHFVFPNHEPGTADYELRDGPITICRFDGDNGQYSLFIGEGKAVEGPHTLGTYVWMEVPDWQKWEHKLVTGPYVHHCAGTYGRAAAVLYEACGYIPGLAADPADPTREELEHLLVHG